MDGRERERCAACVGKTLKVPALLAQGQQGAQMRELQHTA